jgi:DNA-binding NarL/FixJ family response regulator
MYHQSMELTDRQLQVIRGIARGDSDTEIATEIGVTPRTVKLHRQLAAQNLGVVERRRIPLAYFEQTGNDPWPRS